MKRLLEVDYAKAALNIRNKELCNAEEVDQQLQQKFHNVFKDVEL